MTDTEATPGDGIDFESISQQMNKESPMNISTEIQDIRQIVQARAAVDTNDLKCKASVNQ